VRDRRERLKGIGPSATGQREAALLIEQFVVRTINAILSPGCLCRLQSTVLSQCLLIRQQAESDGPPTDVALRELPRGGTTEYLTIGLGIHERRVRGRDRVTWRKRDVPSDVYHRLRPKQTRSLSGVGSKPHEDCQSLEQLGTVFSGEGECLPFIYKSPSVRPAMIYVRKPLDGVLEVTAFDIETREGKNDVRSPRHSRGYCEFRLSTREVTNL
jgi:hypothetical protein